MQPKKKKKNKKKAKAEKAEKAKLWPYEKNYTIENEKYLTTL